MPVLLAPDEIEAANSLPDQFDYEGMVWTRRTQEVNTASVGMSIAWIIENTGD